MFERKEVAIHLVTWNGIVHLPTCLASIEGQTFRDFSVRVVDNGSVDGTVGWIQEHMPQAYVLRNNRNLGFARGHNQALLLAQSPYVLCLNQDLVLEPDWIERAIEIMKSKPELGALGGKLLRYERDETTLTGIRNSGIIDSAGLQIFRSRRVVDRDSGLAESKSSHRSGYVFGVSGACVFFRMAALQDVRFQNEFFDEDFFSYKEDVDLCWRLHRAGWSVWYESELKAYHHRSLRSPVGRHAGAVIRSLKSRQFLHTRYSYRNHILMLIKNETTGTLVPDLPWILWFEFRKFVLHLITRPRVLLGLFEAIGLTRRMRSKARIGFKNAKSPESVRAWWTRHENA